MIKNETEMPMTQPEQPILWRVGNHQPQNIYYGNQYVGVMFSPEHAARVVSALNDTERRFVTERWTG